MQGILRAVLWRRLDLPGAEYCSLGRHADGWALAGTVLVALDGHPLRAHYQVLCDDAWATRAVSVEARTGATERSLQLGVDEHHRWWSAGAELVALRGCLDVDLGITPATNTLPIRRLGLPVGASRDIVAAWVGFPDLAIEALPQRYTRLGEHRYRYESTNGGRAYALEVDGLGLVRRYEDGWECVAVADAGATGEAGKEELR